MSNAATALRLLSPRGNVLGTGDGEALQNVDTTELPDGALCVVQGIGIYLLDKTSPLTPVGTLVVQPSSGPGMWIFVLANEPEPMVAGAHSALSIVSTGATVATSGGQSIWTVFPTTPYDGNFEPDVWSFNSITGVLTNLGPLRVYVITAFLSAAPSTAAAALIGLDIDINGDLVGTSNRTIETMEVLTGAATADQVSLATSRLAAVGTGQTVRAVARNGAAALDIVANALTLFIRPF